MGITHPKRMIKWANATHVILLWRSFYLFIYFKVILVAGYIDRLHFFSINGLFSIFQIALRAAICAKHIFIRLCNVFEYDLISKQFWMHFEIFEYFILCGNLIDFLAKNPPKMTYKMQLCGLCNYGFHLWDEFVCIL